MTAWTDISTAQVLTDADVDAVVMLEIRDRQDYLKEVISGTHTDKIPAQALATHAAGDGQGLRVEHCERLLGSGTATVSADGATYIDTGVGVTVARFPLSSLGLPGSSASGVLYRWEEVTRPGLNSNWWILITRSGGASASHSVAWKLAAIHE